MESGNRGAIACLMKEIRVTNFGYWDEVRDQQQS